MYSVPRWMANELRNNASDFRIHESAMNGDCFFDSMRIILDSVGVRLSCQQLRHLVADPVLDEKNEIVTKTITSWLELYQGAAREQDRPLMEEYKHMSCIANATVPITTSDRQTLFEMMLTNRYWGEQHACRIIEENTQTRMLIFSEDSQRPTLVWYHSSQFKPKYYCFLYLRHQHYMPVSFRGRFIYKWEELPYAVQSFFTKAFTPPKANG